MEYSSASKLKEILRHTATWINLEDVMLNERSQSERTHTVGFLLQEIPKGVKYTETESRVVVARAGRREHGELLFNGYKASAGEDENVLWMDGGDGRTAT